MRAELVVLVRGECVCVSPSFSIQSANLLFGRMDSHMISHKSSRGRASPFLLKVEPPSQRARLCAHQIVDETISVFKVTVLFIYFLKNYPGLIRTVRKDEKKRKKQTKKSVC